MTTDLERSKFIDRYEGKMHHLEEMRAMLTELENRLMAFEEELEKDERAYLSYLDEITEEERREDERSR